MGATSSRTNERTKELSAVTRSAVECMYNLLKVTQTQEAMQCDETVASRLMLYIRKTATTTTTTMAIAIVQSHWLMRQFESIISPSNPCLLCCCTTVQLGRSGNVQCNACAEEDRLWIESTATNLNYIVGNSISRTSMDLSIIIISSLTSSFSSSTCWAALNTTTISDICAAVCNLLDCEWPLITRWAIGCVEEEEDLHLISRELIIIILCSI